MNLKVAVELRCQKSEYRRNKEIKNITVIFFIHLFGEN
jgi:hypothetical protein